MGGSQGPNDNALGKTSAPIFTATSVKSCKGNESNSLHKIPHDSFIIIY